MKKKHNPTKKHLDHPAEVRPGAGPHIAKLHCLKCNVFIKWLSKPEFNLTKGATK